VGAGYDGACASEDTCHLLLFKVDADGQLDTDFGEEGYARIETSYGSFHPMLVALPDGSLLAGAASPADGRAGPLALWKLGPDGTLEEGFGTDGTFLLPGKGRAIDAFLDGDHVLVGGHSTSSGKGSHMVFMRFSL
jgi:hypothetical protein